MKILKYICGIIVILVIVFGILSGLFLPAQKIELDKSGVCPQPRKFILQKAYVEGYFGNYTHIEGGYESQYPNGVFYFSSEPNGKTEFRVNVFIVNYGMNGSEKADRMEFNENNPKEQIIYDHQQQEINFNQRVRLMGYLDDCRLIVKKIEKL